MNIPSCFSTIFKKGNTFSDFLFLSLDNIALPKRDLGLVELAQRTANSFLYVFMPNCPRAPDEKGF